MLPTCHCEERSDVAISQNTAGQQGSHRRNCSCLHEIATAPLGPRNDKSVGLAPQNVCRNHRQPARRSPPAKGTLRPFFTKKFEKSRFSPCGFCLRVVYFHFVDKKSFGQHRTIAASTFAGYFSPIHRFEKHEVHKVHLHFSNLVSTKNLPPNALAESCVAALDRIQNRRDCLP